MTLRNLRLTRQSKICAMRQGSPRGPARAERPATTLPPEPNKPSQGETRDASNPHNATSGDPPGRRDVRTGIQGRSAEPPRISGAFDGAGPERCRSLQPDRPQARAGTARHPADGRQPAHPTGRARPQGSAHLRLVRNGQRDPRPSGIPHRIQPRRQLQRRPAGKLGKQCRRDAIHAPRPARRHLEQRRCLHRRGCGRQLPWLVRQHGRRQLDGGPHGRPCRCRHRTGARGRDRRRR